MQIFNNREAARMAAKLGALTAAGMKVGELETKQKNQNTLFAAEAAKNEIERQAKATEHSLRIASLSAIANQQRLRVEKEVRLKDVKLSKWVSESLGTFTHFEQSMEELLRTNEELGDSVTEGTSPFAIVARMFAGSAPGYEFEEGKLNRQAKEMMALMMHAASGANVTNSERQLWMKDFGVLAKYNSARRMTRLREIFLGSLKRQSIKMRSLPVDEQRAIMQRAPELSHLFLTPNQLEAWVSKTLGIGQKIGSPRAADIPPPSRIERRQGGVRPGLTR
jgi:hypothetical protein